MNNTQGTFYITCCSEDCKRHMLKVDTLNSMSVCLCSHGKNLLSPFGLHSWNHPPLSGGGCGGWGGGAGRPKIESLGWATVFFPRKGG